MKKFLLLVALLVTTVCLSACDCGGNRVKHTTYDCEEFLISQGTQGLNMRENYKQLQLIFYSNGHFKWVGVTTDGKDEIYEGTYRNDYVTEKNEKGESVNVGYRLTLYYDNKPDEFQGIFGYPKYDLTLDGSTLTRLQHQVGGSTNRIIRQTFVKSK